MVHTKVHTGEEGGELLRSTDQPEKRKPLSADTAIKSAEPGEHMVTGAIGLILRVHAAKDGSRTRKLDRARLRQWPAAPSWPSPIPNCLLSPQLARRLQTPIARSPMGLTLVLALNAFERASEAARNVTLGKAIHEYLVIAPPYKNHKSAEISLTRLRGHFGLAPSS